MFFIITSKGQETSTESHRAIDARRNHMNDTEDYIESDAKIGWNKISKGVEKIE